MRHLHFLHSGYAVGLERLQVVHMHYCKGQEPAVIFVLMAEEEMYIYVWFGS